ncbi:MAG: hypothetical protein EOO38_02255 [Cytophagaceae bacterium]|nr:MAG: hypothetical protein EOO38_02255 [Cytophagaceae bacterium]
MAIDELVENAVNARAAVGFLVQRVGTLLTLRTLAVPAFRQAEAAVALAIETASCLGASVWRSNPGSLRPGSIKKLFGHAQNSPF